MNKKSLVLGCEGNLELKLGKVHC